MTSLNHWTQTLDEQSIVWLGLSRQDASVNTINLAVLDELNHLLQDIAQQPAVKGIVIYSLKPKGFIAGADVHAFAHLEAEAVADFLRKGQVVFARLQAMIPPTVAMIDGFCMGGGLELALACDYRIASDHWETRLGLPEVRLGIHPGWGGTVRLPQLIGGVRALSRFILSGSSYAAAQAKKLGVVDVVVPRRQLKRATVFVVTHLPARHHPSKIIAFLERYTWYRRSVAMLIRRQLQQRVEQAHYPAPFAALTLWEQEGGRGEHAYLNEAESVEQLVSHGETAKNLTRLFLLRDRMKSLAKGETLSVTQVHVIGAGVMGGDIAAWCALRGLSVTLQDQTYERIAPAIGRAHRLFQHMLREPHRVQAAMDRLLPDPEGYGIARADVIIEAVFEQLEIKQTLIKHVEQQAKKDALLATNTSSIPLDEINTVMEHPERLVGIHFFNPVSQMELVEIVQGEKTTALMMQQAAAFTNQIGRLPLMVKSKPGFLINRVLMPYLLEAIVLLEEGYAAERIDAAAKSFGMLMGPVTLMDTVGLDVCLAVAQQLVQHFGGAIPKRLQDLVAQKQLGCKSGQGFYRYKQGKAVKKKIKSSPEDRVLASRLIDKMVAESHACLQEGVVADADLLDAGMVFATGFAPFRGGPLHDEKSARLH